MSRVLVADSDEDTRVLYRAAFESDHWDVLEAANGRDALVQALAHSPTLLITELWLPVFDGFALCQELRADKQTEDLPILVVTTEPRSEHHVRAIRAGATALLVKPAPLDDVRATARQLVQEARELRARSEQLRNQARLESERSDMLRQDAQRTVALSQRKRYYRYSTTTPPEAPPALLCPRCFIELSYATTYYGGVNERQAERWDQLECRQCNGRFEYRFRTKRLTSIS